MLLRQKQKCVKRVMDPVLEFCKDREPVSDTCTGTPASENAYLQLPDHQRFVGCEKNYTCSHHVPSLSVKVYAKQVLSSHFDITWGRKLFKKVKVLWRRRQAF